MKIKTGGWLHARDGRNILEYRPSGIVKRTLDFKKKKRSEDPSCGTQMSVSSSLCTSG